MSDIAVGSSPVRKELNTKPSFLTSAVFLMFLAAGLGYGVHGFLDDIQSVHEPLALGVFALLGLALLIALGFEFVNGFHDTANAVATVIYTHSHGATRGRRLVGRVEPDRRARFNRRRCVRHHHAPSRRTDSPGRLQRRLRDDFLRC